VSADVEVEDLLTKAPEKMSKLRLTLLRCRETQSGHALWHDLQQRVVGILQPGNVWVIEKSGDRKWTNRGGIKNEPKVSITVFWKISCRPVFCVGRGRVPVWGGALTKIPALSECLFLLAENWADKLLTAFSPGGEKIGTLWALKTR
jgi:hypothetical protein